MTDTPAESWTETRNNLPRRRELNGVSNSGKPMILDEFTRLPDRQRRAQLRNKRDGLCWCGNALPYWVLGMKKYVTCDRCRARATAFHRVKSGKVIIDPVKKAEAK